MAASHGWSPEAIGNYESDKADAAHQRRIRDFSERSTMIAAAWSHDPKGYYVEYARHCEANADLADDVSEIADYLAEHRYTAQMDRLHGD